MIASKSRPSAAGFTLLELMAVVAVIAVLILIAIPSYSKYVSRAREAEAKTSLGLHLTSEIAFQVEYGSFTNCLYQTGFEPNPQANRYYGAGFTGGVPDTMLCGPGSNQSCYAFVWNPSIPCFVGSMPWGGASRNDSTFFPNLSANPAMAGVGPVGHNTWVQDRSTFLGGAWGSISSSYNGFDFWTIDQNGTLSHVEVGE